MRSFHPLLCISALALCACSDSPADEPGKELESVSGAPVRIVWGQDTGDGSDTVLERGRTRLMALDSEDEHGERVLSDEFPHATKPLLTPDGQTVVFTDQRKPSVYVMPFDGSAEARELAEGMAIETWRDPDSGHQWVYVGHHFVEGKYSFTATRITRIRLDAPDIREVVWEGKPVHPDNFQLSRDGRMASGLFPWPKAGRATLGDGSGSWERFGRGCWTSMAPDNSRIAWAFDGPHKNVELFDGENHWKVDVHGIPGNTGFEVYHPRWSNHPRILVVTGPYKNGEGGNRIRGGGESVELYLGRFDAAATRVEDWVRVTHNTSGDFYPDVWVSGGEAHDLDRPQQEMPHAPAPHNQNEEDTVFAWAHGARENRLPEIGEHEAFTCEWQLTGHALYSPRHGLWLGGTPKAGARAEIPSDRVQRWDRDEGRLSVLLRIRDAGDGHEPGWLVGTADRTWGVGFRPDGRPGLFVNGAFHACGGARLKPRRWTRLAVAWSKDRVWMELDDTGHDLPLDLHPAKTERSWDGLVAGDTESTVEVLHVRLGEHARRDRAETRTAREIDDRITALPDPDSVRVQAEVVATSEVPRPEDIAPYRRALVGTHYRVRKVLDGQMEDKEFVGYRWAVLDAEVVSPAPSKGEVHTLEMAVFDEESMPQLRGERTINTLVDSEIFFPYLVLP